MEQQIAISLQTVARLKAHAEPLVDTFDTVINRAVDALENANGKGATGTDGSIPLANPAAPPNLSFTTVRSIVMNGKRFAANEAYWNHLLFAVIREAKKSLSQEKVTELIVCNHVIGKKEKDGYKYLEDVGISVQGQDANGAWKAIYHIVQALNFSVDVVFKWQDNVKASAPGEHARFLIAKK